MIPSGTLDHERLARPRAAFPHTSRTAHADASQRAAEAAIEKLLASWRSDASRGLESAHLWEDTAMEAIDALSALLAEVDLATSGPLLISQRART